MQIHPSFLRTQSFVLSRLPSAPADYSKSQGGRRYISGGQKCAWRVKRGVLLSAEMKCFLSPGAVWEFRVIYSHAIDSSFMAALYKAIRRCYKDWISEHFTNKTVIHIHTEYLYYFILVASHVCCLWRFEIDWVDVYDWYIDIFLYWSDRHLNAIFYIMNGLLSLLYRFYIWSQITVILTYLFGESRHFWLAYSLKVLHP